jgi:hypothetical protein
MDANSAETARLIGQARAGDAAARNDLFARHRGRLRRMVEMRLDRRLAGRIDASDVIPPSFGGIMLQRASHPMRFIAPMWFIAPYWRRNGDCQYGSTSAEDIHPRHGEGSRSWRVAAFVSRTIRHAMEDRRVRSNGEPVATRARSNPYCRAQRSTWPGSSYAWL